MASQTAKDASFCIGNKQYETLLPLQHKEHSKKKDHHLRSFKKKNNIKCLLNLILKDEPMISEYIILRMSDLAASA